LGLAYVKVAKTKNEKTIKQTRIKKVYIFSPFSTEKNEKFGTYEIGDEIKTYF